MVTLDHRTIQIALVLLFMLVAGVCILRIAKRWRRLVRLPLKIVAFLLVITSGGLLLVEGCMQVTTETQADAPIYSPDRAHAIVVRRWDAGPLGGSATYINLYSYGGLREETIAGAEWFDEIAVGWRSNSEVELRSDFPGFYVCNNAASVRVSCSSPPSNSADVK